MRVLLVDDEALARDRLREMLGAFAGVEIVAEAADGEEAIDRIVTLRPDLVFLDVQMPGASGLEVARSLARPGPGIVFCTGFDEYAVEAFELAAVDYLLKPVTRARLAQTIARVERGALPDWNAALARAARVGDRQTRFLAKCGGRFRVVPQDAVLCFDSEQGLTALVTAHERHWMEPTLNDLEARLDPAVFFRVSRAAIVRLDAIVEVVPLVGGHGEVRLTNGARLPVSRRRLRALLARIEGQPERP